MFLFRDRKPFGFYSGNILRICEVGVHFILVLILYHTSIQIARGNFHKNPKDLLSARPQCFIKAPIDKAHNRVYSIGIHMNDCSYMEIKEDLVWSRRSII